MPSCRSTNPSAHTLAAERTLLWAFTLGLWACASGVRAEPQQPLAAGSTAGGVSRKGELRSHPLRLKARECAFGKLQPSAAVELRIWRPNDTALPLRKFRGQPGRLLEFGFCVELAGVYRLELRGLSGAGTYQLTLDSVLARQDSPPSAASPSELQSPRLRAVAAGELSARAFWDGLKEGTPLIESRGPDNALVTFVYRGSPRTRSVALSLPAWTFAFAEPALARLPGTDIFWKSIVLPSTTRMSYQLIIDPPLVANSEDPLAERAKDAVARADPRNPKLVAYDPELDAFQLRSLLELPGAPPETWLAPRKPAARAGKLDKHIFASKALDNERQLHVYLPPGYRDTQAKFPLLIFFDGESYLKESEIPTPRLLDNLIAAKAIKPLVAVFVHNATADSRDHELPCNPALAEFAAGELLPFIRTNYRVTSDPAHVALAGASFGGLASSFVALLHPELFGLVISQSGSYWWSFPRGHSAFDGSEEPGWLRRRVQRQPRAQVQFYLSAGIFESKPNGAGLLEQARLQRDTLRERGYSVAYQEFAGGHDFTAWRATLPDALRAFFAP